MLDHALRPLRRHPARALLMILTLALGLGATTAIVSAIRGVLLAPLPFPRPEQVVMISETEERDSFGTVGFTTYAEWRESLRSFSSIAAISSRSYTLTSGGEAEQLMLLGITHNTFGMYGIRPILGRDFTPADDVRGGARVVLLSHELWSRRFGRDESIVGRTIRMSDTDFEVIGVMPPRTRLTPDEWAAQRIDAWTPLRYNTTLEFACRSCRHLRAFGRLRDGVTVAAAEREAETFTAALRRMHPREYPSRGWVAVDTLQNVVVGRPVTSSLWMIFGLAALVLVAAIANAASLGLSALFVRHNELVVRQSLGATPKRIALMLIGEAIAVALISSALAIALAYGAVAWLRANAGAFLPRAADLVVDPTIMAICVAIALLSGAVIGAIPAMRARRWSLVVNNRGVVAGRSRAQQVLVGANIALSVMLLVGSTLLLRSVRNLFAIPAGFDATNAVSFRMSIAGTEYEDPKALLALHDRFLAEARQLPGLESIALTSQLPFAEDQDNAGLTPEDRDTGFDGPDAQRFAITPGYFATLRVPIRAGRAFNDTDTASSEPVIILNQAAARALWQTDNVVNKRVRIGGGEGFRRIVGVVGNIAPGDLGAAPMPQAYLPLPQFGPPTDITGVARTLTGAEPLRAIMRRLDPDVPFYRIASLPTLVARSEARRQFILACLTAFSAVVLALAMIGVYGILALFVSSRKRELALRMALGASAAGVFRMVLRQGLGLAVIAIVVGIGASAVLGRFLEAMLYGVRNGDPMTLVSVTLSLIVASGIACAVPAWRASRVSPEAALRDE
ncbi:MAG TPA: ABC transporter permease [Thermoanaerobaculia bacterium]|nr:ABC transporter permease [Thermoanaerobaculia bacterium]